MWILGSKMFHLPYFKYNRNFSQEKSSVPVLYLLNPTQSAFTNSKLTIRHENDAIGVGVQYKQQNEALRPALNIKERMFYYITL